MQNCQVDGDPNAPILIVGMAPGREELSQNRPFVGGSGALLWAIAKAGGWNRADCYIVNVIGEWPKKKNGTPSAEQLMRWRPDFLEYLGRSRARFAVPMGGDALTALTGLSGIEEWRGYLVHPSECLQMTISVERTAVYKTSSSKKGFKKGDPRIVRERVATSPPLPATVEWILPSLHPAGVLRSGRKTLPAFRADLARVGRVLRNELNPPSEFLTIRNGTLPMDPGPFVIDVETVPFLRVGVAGLHQGKYAAWSNPLDVPVKHAIANLYKKGSVFVAHNAQFDLHEMAKHGMPWSGEVFCTMFGAYLLQPDLYKGLNEVCSLYFDKQRWKHKAEEDHVGYNLEDCTSEYELYEIEKQLLASEGMLDYFQSVMMPAYVGALCKMTSRGIKVHRTRREEWLAELQVEDAQLLEKWQSLVGNINPRSSPQVQSLLYRKMGLKVAYSKRGSESAERGALYELLSRMDQTDLGRPVIETLLALRKNGTLLRNFARKPLGDDERFHPYYLPVTKDSDKEDAGKGAAGTGRIQARGPNIQQLPQSARRMVIPSDPSLILVAFDFKQLELRIAAALAQDQRLLATLAKEDPFADIMAKFNCDRTRAKNVAYGCVPFHTKALTREGWKEFSELDVGMDIMAFAPERDRLEWQPLLNKVYHAEAPLVELKNSYWSATTTPDHRWWGKKNRQGSHGTYYSPYHSFTTSDVGRTHCITASAMFAGGAGCGKGILHKHETDWLKYVLDMSIDERAAFLNGVIISDGHALKGGTAGITQKRGPHFEAMLLASFLHGYRVAVNRRKDGEDMCVMRLCKNPYVTGARLTKTDVGTGPVWCPQVPSGYLVMRQHDTISITGNSLFLGGPGAITNALRSRGIFVPRLEIKRLQNDFFEEYRGLWRWRQAVINEVGNHYCLRTPFGRIRYFYNGRGDGPAACNFKCQGTAADIIWNSLLAIEEACTRHGGAQLASIHDEALTELPRTTVGVGVSECKHILEREWPQIAPGFRVPVEVKIGENWGEMTAWQPN